MGARAGARARRDQRPQKPKAVQRTASRDWFVLLLPALLIATLFAYQPAWHGGVLWDDDHYVTEKVLSAANGLWRIWFDVGATEQYFPIVFSTLWGLHHFFGENTIGYHLVNVVLHAGSAFMFALILRRLAVPGAVLAGVIFALHPVHVESVAWITEIKNTLSGVFFLGAALAYLRFDATRRVGPYLIALGLFVVALLSKTSTATLPAGLLAIFWWQRGRLSWRRDVVPLLPLFGLGAIDGLAITWVEYSVIGAHGAEFRFTLLDRFLIAGRAVWFYMGKLVWPVGFTLPYARWQVDPGLWWQYLYPIALIALLVALWRWRAHSRAPLAALLFFCVTLAPTLGVVNLYYFRYALVADHFQYLASFGSIAFAAAALATLVARWRVRAAGRVMVLVVGAPLAFLTWTQAHNYADAETLYRATIANDPTSFMAHNNLGGVLDASHRTAEAIAHFTEAERLQPNYVPPHVNMGRALLHEGRTAEAVKEFREAVRLDPADASAHAGLGRALAEAGETTQAIAQLSESLRLDPGVEETHNNLGVAFDTVGRTDDAITQYKAALALNPNWAEAHNNLGAALATKGRIDEAAAEFDAAIRLAPDYGDAHRNLGLARSYQKRPDDAIREFEAALAAAPGLKDVHYNLAVLLSEKGATAQAISHLRIAVQLDPGNVAARTLLEKLTR